MSGPGDGVADGTAVAEAAGELVALGTGGSPDGVHAETRIAATTATRRFIAR
jgi:hypothetical protein